MRYVEPHILRDLEKKMVFLGGPRQSGKTTVVKRVLSQSATGKYFNWDYDEHRQQIQKKVWGVDDKLIVFDELHKHPRWKSWLKGVYDVQKDHHQFLVTGSARLDVYRKGGDSLFGRYHYWRLHPFTLSELPKGMSGEDGLNRLMTVGGFPEPFLDADERQARRWRRERYERVLREDIRDLENVRNLQTLRLFVDLLRQRVGGLVVLNNLAQELQVAPKTLKSWLELLERMYLVFVVRPWSRQVPRAVLKPPKVYFFDNMDVLGDEGVRFENLVATHLLKHIQFLEDLTGHSYQLAYVRDKDGREVDFVVVRDGQVVALVEAKLGDKSVSRSLRYYAERLQPQHAVQVVWGLRDPIKDGKLSVLPPLDILGRHDWLSP